MALLSLVILVQLKVNENLVLSKLASLPVQYLDNHGQVKLKVCTYAWHSLKALSPQAGDSDVHVARTMTNHISIDMKIIIWLWKNDIIQVRS